VVVESRRAATIIRNVVGSSPGIARQFKFGWSGKLKHGGDRGPGKERDLFVCLASY